VSSIGHILNKELCDIYEGKDMPIRSYTFAAGFSFAPIEFALEVPIDPRIYWNYEETDITLRGYTHGWDFFAAPEPIIWHRYNTTGKMAHIEGDLWVGLENFSNEHAPKKYFDPHYAYPQIYKLGTDRCITSFEAMYNLSFATKEFNPRPKKDMLIVVPYRDRDEHLRAYMANVPSYFKDISHDILLCELDQGCPWNAGLTCNSLINFGSLSDYEYIYISHVDVYPITGWEWPEEGEFITDLGDVGSCLVRTKDFLSVGGYGNDFWGWGAEDDNLYMKLWSKGLKRRHSTSKYHTEFQSHERPFNGKNYTHNLRQLKEPLDFTSIFQTNKVSVTHGLTKVAPNIYKQNVRYTVQKSPNKRAVFGYIKGIKDFRQVAPFVKSAIYYSYNYDVWMVCVDCNIDKDLNMFGVKVVNRTPVVEDLFFDRLHAYKDIISSTNYEQVLHLDVTDAYFQANPFERLHDELVIVSEGVKIGECKWNTGAMLNLYGNSFPDNDVVCGGLIAGTTKRFVELCDKVIQESSIVPEGLKMHGADQPILNKLIHSGELPISVYNSQNLLAAHLHHYFQEGNEEIRISGITVTNQDNNMYSIVHQYNRDITMYNDVLNYFASFFAIDQAR
jgi:hypothetical protein